MLSQIILPALAVLGVAAAQSSSCSTSATLTINSVADATAIADCPTFTGSIAVGPNAGAGGTLDLSGPKQITGNLVVQNNGIINTLTSTSINSIGGTWRMFNMTTLSTLRFDAIKSVNIISFDTLQALPEFTFGSTITSAKSVTITNSFLTTLDGINLNTVDTLEIAANIRLMEFSTQVANVTASLDISNNGHGLTVALPNLIFANMATFRNISSISMPSLSKVNQSLFFDETFIESFSAPNLTTVGDLPSTTGALTFAGNSKISNITLNGLTSVGGAINIANNTALTSVSFAKLAQVGGSISILGSFTSASAPMLKDVKGTADVETTASSLECSDWDNAHASGYIQASETCKFSQSAAATATAGSGSGSGSDSSSPSSSSTKKNSGSMNGVNGAVAALSVLGAILLV